LQPPSPACRDAGRRGATEAEALDNIRAAIAEYLSVVDEQLRGEDVRVVEIAT
jgi:predicted RNase H-like HicB family nuclease